MAKVLLDNVWVQGQMFTTGTSRDDIDLRFADLIGDHLWVDPDQRPNLDSSGNSLSGLLDNVWVDGKAYEKGSIPPPEVAVKIGDHLWVGGVRPDGITTAPAVASPPDPTAVIPVVVEPVSATPEPAGTTEDVPPVAPDVVPANRGPEPDRYDKGGWLPGGTFDVVNDSYFAETVVDEPVAPINTPEPPRTPLVDPASLTEPPRAGRGASKAAWVAYAAALGLNTTDDMSRDDIIELVDAHLALTAE